jgi:hypothetical protein
MVPKTHFKYSLKKGDDVATNVPTPHGRRVTCNSEKISLDHLSKWTTSSGVSGSHCKAIDHNPPIIPSNESMETYPLHFVEPQDTLTDLNDVGDSSPLSTVCAILNFQPTPFILM